MNLFKEINDILVNLTYFSEPMTNQVIEIQTSMQDILMFKLIKMIK